MDSSALTLIAAAVVGYLAGSLSGARIIGGRRRAGDLSTTRVVLDGTGSTVENLGVSPSALQARQGARSGLPAGGIDIAKAFIPALIARLIWPDTPEHVVVAAAAFIGHVYPLYHRFVGGFGISPLLGGLFGFFTYATYDLTNLATLEDWPLKVAMVDIAWGVVLCAIVATCSFLIARAIS